VLGCHIVGDSAAETIQCVAIAVKMKATKADFDATIAPASDRGPKNWSPLRTPTARYVRRGGRGGVGAGARTILR